MCIRSPRPGRAAPSLHGSWIRACDQQWQPLHHDGRWGLATLECCLAILESGREHREIELKHQILLVMLTLPTSRCPRRDVEYGLVYEMERSPVRWTVVSTAQLDGLWIGMPADYRFEAVPILKLVELPVYSPAGAGCACRSANAAMTAVPSTSTALIAAVTSSVWANTARATPINASPETLPS